MDSNYLSNPLNKRKKKYQYFLRIFENMIKKIFVYFFLLPLFLPFLIKNYFSKYLIYFEDFYNHNGIVFFVFILKKHKNAKFSINISDLDKVLSRFGFIFLIKNFTLKINCKFNKSISFKNKKSDFYLNYDYFYFFDDNIDENTNNFVLPFYLPRDYYLKNKETEYLRLIDSKKKFKIIFSGSSHDDWYDDLKFKNKEGSYFLNRQEILNILKTNFFDNILTINHPSQLNNIHNSGKEILILETDPSLKKRKKSFSEFDHLKLISESNFFLCMPGTSMPLCYHLIESCLVGTVPILSYNDFLHPKFESHEALFFFSKKQLINIINEALKIDKIKYKIIQKNIIQYYSKNLSINGISKKLFDKKTPIEIFLNLDHSSSNLRNIRN